MCLRRTNVLPSAAVSHWGSDHLVGEPEQVTDRARRRIGRRATASQQTFDGWVRLESSGWYLQVADLLNEDEAATLMAEDAAWHFAVADWRRRRPPVWRRSKRRAWLAEEELLARKAAHLVQASTRLRTLRPVRDATA